jgi:hypothetical protein
MTEPIRTMEKGTWSIRIAALSCSRGRASRMGISDSSVVVASALMPNSSMRVLDVITVPH